MIAAEDMSAEAAADRTPRKPFHADVTPQLHRTGLKTIPLLTQMPGVLEQILNFAPAVHKVRPSGQQLADRSTIRDVSG